MFETVASDSNDKYHEGARNKFFFNATQFNSIDLQFNMKILMQKIYVDFDNHRIAFICRLGSIVLPF